MKQIIQRTMNMFGEGAEIERRENEQRGIQIVQHHR